MTVEVKAEGSELDLLAAVAAAEGGASRRSRLRRALAAGTPGEVGAASVPRITECRRALDMLGWTFTPARGGTLPEGVAALADPPLGLFHRGELPAGPAVAVVGSRAASAYGREVAEYLGRELADAGAWVVSGMARGVDAAAHRGALAAGGRTAAVWGAGPDHVYPREHRSLAEAIAASGCLVTEYPPGTPPRPHRFPERNRIIVGLVSVVVVVEAAERSGALVTARLALEEGRDVMAVPGSIFSRLSAGPNGLLRAGAAPVLQARDVLDALGISPQAGSEDHGPSGIAAAIPSGEAVTVDSLAARLGWPVARVAEALLEAELEGSVSRDPDGRYRRSRLIAR